MYYNDGAMAAFFIGGFIGGIIWGALCAALASKKNRSPVGFFVLGFFFGAIPFIFLAFQDVEGQRYNHVDHFPNDKTPEPDPVVLASAEAREKKIESLEDLLNDPQIKQESRMIRKMYGQKAQERYLAGKKEEFGL